MLRRPLAAWFCQASLRWARRRRVPAAEPTEWAAAHSKELFTLYKHFHQHPELSLQERKTAGSRG